MRREVINGGGDGQKSGVAGFAEAGWGQKKRPP